ncbi:MAG: hypothetical protein ACREXR_15325 [Gammaproteobacteria bacterium]
MEAASEPGGPQPEIFDTERDEEVFRKTFAVLRNAAQTNEAVGQKVFGAVDSKGQIRGQFAVYHYEGLTLGIQKIIDQLNENDSKQMERLGERLLQIKVNPALRDFTGGGKNTAQAFRDRIKFFADELSLVV